MYAWLWRKIPGGLRGKVIGTLGLLTAVVLLLWYVIFPWAEPLLPFDDVQVGDPNAGYEQVVPSSSVHPSADPDHDIPYDTGEGTPSARPSRR